MLEPMAGPLIFGYSHMDLGAIESDTGASGGTPNAITGTPNAITVRIVIKYPYIPR